MISWVSSTRHISGFLSWPSYTMACVEDKQRQGSRSAYRLGATPPRAPQASGGGRCPAPRGEATGTPGHPPTPPLKSVAGMLRSARLPSSFHGCTPGLSSGGLRRGQGRACRDRGTASEGAQPPSRLLAPGPPQPGVVLCPLFYTKARSSEEVDQSALRVQTPGGRRAQGQPSLRHEALPRPGSPAASPAPCRPHTHTSPAPRSPSRGRRLGLRG